MAAKIMLRTGLVIDPRYQDHDTMMGHPECPARIGALLELCNAYQRTGLVRLPPRVATLDELADNHDPEHIDRVASTAGSTGYAFDADTPTSARSYETALLSAGGCLSLLDAVISGEVDNGFALVRPPGHHAEWNRAMGFCLFNNVAVAARYLQHVHHMNRILIMDWDVHHGNGTQHSFEDDPGVLYISTHQFPLYPGTGAVDDVGVGEGKGAIVNLPFPPGYGDVEYLEAFEHIIVPIAQQFDPQCVLISAGFDAHADDPLANMLVSETGFAIMARELVRVAQDHADGRCVAILEGGYNLSALQRSVAAVLDEMEGTRLTEPRETSNQSLPQALEAVRHVQKLYWNLSQVT